MFYSVFTDGEGTNIFFGYISGEMQISPHGKLRISISMLMGVPMGHECFLILIF